jgi:hypothetical protein
MNATTTTPTPRAAHTPPTPRTTLARRFDDPALRDAVMRDFLASVHFAAIANAHNLTLTDLLEWWAHPQVQSDLARLRELLEAQRLIATLAASSECTAILMGVARRAPGTDSARKAAAQLLRSIGPAKRTARDTATAPNAAQPTTEPVPHQTFQPAPPPSPRLSLTDSLSFESCPAPAFPQPAIAGPEPSLQGLRLACHDV